MPYTRLNIATLGFLRHQAVLMESSFVHHCFRAVASALLKADLPRTIRFCLFCCVVAAIIMKACNGSIAAQVVNNPGAQITNQPSLINDQLTFNYTSNGWRAKAFMVIPAISNDDKKAKKSNIYKITSANENIIIDRKEVDKGVDVQVIPLQFTTVNTPPFGNTEAIMVGNSAIKYAIALPQKPGGLSVQSVANFVGEVGGDIPLIVTTGNESASHIELVRGTIQEKNTGSILTYKTLCDDSGSRCGSAINIPPNTTAKLRMVGVAPSGQYKGVIVITSREVRAGNSVDATIDLSAIENKIVGFVFILFGVLISTIGVSVARRWYARKSAEVDANRYKERIINLEVELGTIHTDVGTPRIDEALKRLTESLSVQELKANDLPPVLGSPFESINPGPPKLAQYLQERATLLITLEQLVHGGIAPIAMRIHTETNDPTLKLVASQIDALADRITPTTTPEVVMGQVTQILGVGAAQRLWAGTSQKVTKGTSIKVSIRELKEISFISWVFVIAATVLAGAYVLLISSSGNGFGEFADYCACCLWGLGFPIGAQALQLTVTSALSALSANRT